jgi:RNase P/RNase MRP subunit POP5
MSIEQAGNSPALPVTLEDGRTVGKVEKIEFTSGGAGNQWTTISGTRYATWWDLRTKNWGEGDIVSFKATCAPLWHGQPEVAQASRITKFDLANLPVPKGNQPYVVLRINRRQRNAIVAALRLLEHSVEKGLVVPNDGDIGDILTCSGDHEALSLDEITSFCDAILDGRGDTWNAV